MSRGVLKPTIAPQNSNSSCSVLTACQNSDHFFHKLSCGLQLTSCLSLQPGSPRRSGEDENSPKYLHLYMFYYIVLVWCTVLGSLTCCGLGLLFSLMHYHFESLLEEKNVIIIWLHCFLKLSTMSIQCFVSYVPLQSHNLGLSTKVSTDTKSGMVPLNHVIQTFFKKGYKQDLNNNN